MKFQKSLTATALILGAFTVANAQPAQNPMPPMTNYVSDMPQGFAGSPANYLSQMIQLQPLLSAAPQPALQGVLETLGIAQPMGFATPEESSGPIRNLLNGIRNR